MTIFGVHPADKDLKFLTGINLNFKKKYPEHFKYLRLEANNQTHEYCLRRLAESQDGMIFFFCHALEKSIRGCKIENQASQLSSRDFNYGTLISPSKNIEVLKGKKVFCLACFSKDLGISAIEVGAKVFLGFGDIPFYIREKYKEDIIEAAVKKELIFIMQSCLENFLDRNWSFNDLSNHMKISIDKRRFELLLDKSNGIKIRREISNILSRIKNGITMFGNGELRFID